MIKSTAFELVIGWLKDLITFAKTTVVIDFQGYNLTLWHLWTSLTVLVIFVNFIVAPVLGFNVDKKSIVKEKDGDD